MNTDNKTTKRKISALDLFVLILLLLAAVGVLVRAYIGTDGILPEIGKKSSEYTLSFEVTSITTGKSAYLTQGESLFAADGTLIGTIGEGVTVTPALVYTVDADGKYVQTYAGADNGDSSLVDVRGVLTTSGYETDYGFLVGGKTYLAPNYVTSLHTRNVTVDVKITNVAEVGK